jgi:hypothetical protein
VNLRMRRYMKPEEPATVSDRHKGCTRIHAGEALGSARKRRGRNGSRVSSEDTLVGEAQISCASNPVAATHLFPAMGRPHARRAPKVAWPATHLRCYKGFFWQSGASPIIKGEAGALVRMFRQNIATCDRCRCHCPISSLSTAPRRKVGRDHAASARATSILARTLSKEVLVH